MWYKEWRDTFKGRMIIQALACSLLTLGSGTGYLLGAGRDSDSTYFVGWWFAATMVLIITGLLFSTDMISREIDGGTMSFLLTRPLDRADLYQQKLFMRLSLLLGTFLLASLPVLLMTGPTDLGRHLLLVGTGLSIGSVAICTGALSSALARLDGNSAVKKSGILLFLTVIALFIGLAVTSSNDTLFSNIANSTWADHLKLILVSFGLDILLYRVGQKAFDTVEI